MAPMSQQKNSARHAPPTMPNVIGLNFFWEHFYRCESRRNTESITAVARLGPRAYPFHYEEMGLFVTEKKEHDLK
jgi:hypothetical protein